LALPAKYVAEKDGYRTCWILRDHDLSERAFQLEGTGQWVKGKSADTFGPIGPWLVTRDEVPTRRISGFGWRWMVSLSGRVNCHHGLFRLSHIWLAISAGS